jgi:hypothetical protein
LRYIGDVQVLHVQLPQVRQLTQLHRELADQQIADGETREQPYESLMKPTAEIPRWLAAFRRFTCVCDLHITHHREGHGKLLMLMWRLLNPG